MARKKQQQQNGWTKTTFIRCELSSENKKELVKWSEKQRENIDDLVTEVVQTGHKISFSFNDNSDSFICSVTGKPEDCDNANKCYTSHGKTYVMALWVALFKFHVIWQREPWEDAGETEDFG